MLIGYFAFGLSILASLNEETAFLTFKPSKSPARSINRAVNLAGI
ncbi:hypothetical protein Mcup_1876 [Metallosphaera cuprina Ar-4]|uniref:Uncharacterized protein n=1 Tax=Metallosphaera cuprina (strain Ar-4) TaxID=1006006 RepID=F4G191_METCR|nr:hypothetical protein Mcup_1876 [Metallosphaera cuprina Ar-4]